MHHAAAVHPASAARVRRPRTAVTALAVAAVFALGACSTGSETAPETVASTQVSTSSSSSSIPTTTTAEATDPSPAPAPAPAPSAVAQSTTSTFEPPPNVVGTGGPCQFPGELAQADDGSLLACAEDPGGAGPLWLPAPDRGGW